MDSEVADDYADALDALWYRQDCDNDDPLYRRFLAFRSRLASAEGELAALKARIAGLTGEWRRVREHQLKRAREFRKYARDGSDGSEELACRFDGLAERSGYCADELERLLREDDGRCG